MRFIRSKLAAAGLAAVLAVTTTASADATPAASQAASYTVASCKKLPPGLIYVTRFDFCARTNYVAVATLNKKVVGKASFFVTLVGKAAQKGKRRVAFALAIDSLKPTGSLVGGSLSVDLSCAGRGCSSAKPKVRTMSGWKKNGNAAFAFIAPPGPDPVTKAATGRFGFEFIVTAPTGGRGVARDAVDSFRCDTAKYLNAGSGCVFTAGKPIFTLSISDPGVNEAARHVYDALINPGKTFPKKAGKKIPGGTSTDPLHRLRSDSGQAANGKAAAKACVAAFGKKYTDGGTKDCDEYPFRSTQEGAAKNQVTKKFSVRAIDRSDNRRAGARLNTFYKENRVLDKDAFIVGVRP